MKTLVLLPIKDEDWILDYTLSVFETFADHIIVADQNSSDDSLKICAKHPKVKVIKNEAIGHSNEVRWKLLEEARKIDGENLIFCLDADEIISQDTVEHIKKKCAEYGKGTCFSLFWIQTWKNIQTQRIDTVWGKNIKPVAFFDDRKMDYAREYVINDHTSRIPTLGIRQQIETEYVFIHLHFAAWNRSIMKQAWYRCSELIAKPDQEKYINYKYSNGDDTTKVLTTPMNPEWIKGITLPNESIFETEDLLRKRQIFIWFQTYGILFFEGLNIWHINEFREYFIKETGRSPRVRNYSNILLYLNELRIKLKNIF